MTQLSPYDDSVSELINAHSVIGVTMTACDESEDVAVMRNGYMRDLNVNDINGWEPAEGALLWCGTNGRVTTTRPTSGAQIVVGTYLGYGVAHVHVTLIPSIGDLSYVARETPVHEDILKWDSSQSLYVPVQLNHRRWSWVGW